MTETDRLDRLETAIDALRVDVTATRVSIARIDEKLQQPLHCGLHGTVLFGDGSEDNPGIVSRVRSLESAEARRRWSERAVIAAAIPLSLSGVVWIVRTVLDPAHAAGR